MLCNDTLKVEKTFNLYPRESKVILLLLSNKQVQTQLSITGHRKAPLRVNTVWDLLVELLKGHLAQDAKWKASQGFTQTLRSLSVQVNSLYHKNQRWKNSLIITLAIPATVHALHYELPVGYFNWSSHSKTLTLRSTRKYDKSFGSGWNTSRLRRYL